MKILLLLIVIFCAAFCAAGQKSVSGDYRIRFKNKQLIVKYQDESHPLEVAGRIDAEKITGSAILFARRKEAYLYLVIDVFGQSRAKQNDRQCGAGTEANLIWIKLDAGWRIAAIDSVRYESCWSSIDMGDGIKISGEKLYLEFENFRDDVRVKLSFDAAEPEKGFLIEETKLEEN